MCIKYEDNEKDSINIESEQDFQCFREYCKQEQLKNIKLLIDCKQNKYYVDYNTANIEINPYINPYYPFYKGLLCKVTQQSCNNFSFNQTELKKSPSNQKKVPLKLEETNFKRVHSKLEEDQLE